MRRQSSTYNFPQDFCRPQFMTGIQSTADQTKGAMRMTSEPTAMRASECDACATSLSDVLHAGQLRAAFRPIADFASCEIFGYVAAVRGPVGTTYGSFGQLARIARTVGRLGEFTEAAVATTVRSFVDNSANGLIFVTLPAGIVSTGSPGLPEKLYRRVDALDFHSGRIVMLIPDLHGDELAAGPEFIMGLRRRGFLLGARGFCCAAVDRRLWTTMVPDFMLVEEHQIEGLDFATVPHTALFEQLRSRDGSGIRIVADGIRCSNDFNVVRQLGISYGAGDFIGRPNPVPARAMPAASHKTIAAGCACNEATPSAPRGILDRLLTKSVPVAPATHAEEVFMLFEHNVDLRAVAVVEDGVPRGLISRYEMVDNMARPFRHELYGRKPCTRFMDTQPLVVDVAVSLQELSEIVVTADPRHLISGFIITDRGRYLGMGSVQDLVREVTAMQMEAAMYANPLTQLPGNVPINQHIDNLLAAQTACCIAYCDLDHFKPFNDVYGYAKGDEVIQLTARVLSGACDADLDFVGHIGGDDFVMILRSHDWQARCQAALDAFGAEVASFFSHDDIERGGYVTENRKGELEFHRLTSLSIGAVEAQPGTFQNHLQVSKVAAEVKKQAKGIPGNSLFVNHRAYASETPVQPADAAEPS
jgi:GGDEF domain-containing protein/EAL domain-containing protein (putative c-di-GMP-specific phosphodiesterase class I)